MFSSLQRSQGLPRPYTSGPRYVFSGLFRTLTDVVRSNSQHEQILPIFPPCFTRRPVVRLVRSPLSTQHQNQQQHRIFPAVAALDENAKENGMSAASVDDESSWLAEFETMITKIKSSRTVREELEGDADERERVYLVACNTKDNIRNQYVSFLTFRPTFGKKISHMSNSTSNSTRRNFFPALRFNQTYIGPRAIICRSL